jgi:purine-binding chemotaxis protein CheW
MTFLAFRLGESTYVVDAISVREIDSLPEILRLEEAPPYIAGFLNLRGQIVLVIDLPVKFGHPTQPYSAADGIAVLESGGELAAVLIKEPQIIEITAEDIVAESAYFREAAVASKSPFICGWVKWNNQVAMRLNPENLVGFARDHSSDLDESESPVASLVFSTSSAEKILLRDRADLLAQPVAHENSEGLIAFAVVGLGGEFFGIELLAVREFCNVSSVAPIPGCPPHIVGQMSLRGNFITVVDISNFLGVPRLQRREERKLVVMSDSRLEAGVLVDELLDVLRCPAEDLSFAPKSAHPQSGGLGREHICGTATHGSRTLTLLDLPLLLANVSLQVNETPT